MAKKSKYKISRAKQKNLTNLSRYLIPGVIGLVIGLSITTITATKSPSNIVWAADKTVVLPNDLRNFLLTRNDCREYRGTGSPKGVGLWGVYQVHNAKFAKIAYGCSNNLENYIMAVKTDKKWQLLQPTEYFAPFSDATEGRLGAVPYCSVVEKYKIPKDIESFCIKTDGTAQANTQK